MSMLILGVRRIRLRVTAAVLCFVMLFLLLPVQGMRAAAAADMSWAQPSLNKLTGWGVMRGDESGLRPQSAITRAEFTAMVNRAYGYDTPGKTPFTDVSSRAWYADDIAIAYKAGYFSGTGTSTASPEKTLTREQAMVLIARNMRLKDTAGEITEFTDGRKFNSWSKSAVKSATKLGLINGYPDGSFRPERSVTRAEMATLLSSALGTLYKEPGEYNPAGVYGNVTISSPGVTLRNATITGDLYITGGVDLGDVLLENVRVLGRIVSAGGGESNKGDSSIILRNVEADNLVVNSMGSQYVTLRSEGDTKIDHVSVVTGAYIEDRTPAGTGLKSIVLEGTGAKLDVAGNIEEVINKAPNSSLTVAQGTTKQLTVDEMATNSTLNVADGAVTKKLNLDIATKVNGTGDVSSINVNAAGSSANMLPDMINIRPGVTANITGKAMDTKAGQESSADPKLLAGYPKAKDVAPTTFTAGFSGNKAGTVYWAVSAIADGSVKEADLVAPPTYSSKIIKSGNVKLLNSDTEVTAKVPGLTSGGSYYLSAVLEDARGWRSPVKVTAFTTPDDSIPNFATGYPVMSKITSDSAQVTVMPTKNSKLYYAVLPKGSTAPKDTDFKSAAVTGNLGYGVLDVKKNTTDSFTVNDKPLEELVSYDLYLWLADADGGKGSAVKKITFTTVDGTPPVFQTQLTVNAVAPTSIGFMFNLNEDGTVYWVAVKQGTEYPKPAAGSSETQVDWKSDYAKLQVMSGMNALKSGKTAAKENKDTSFNISGLEVQTAYDIYYVAEDKAGNYSETIYKITANTLDNIPPTVTQEFNRYAGTNTKAPLADTDIAIIFSEGVQRASTNEVLMTLYNKVADSAAGSQERETAKDKLAQALRNTILLYNSTGNGPATRVAERTDNSVTNWVIDYRNATVKMEDGKVIVTFATTTDVDHNSALSLSSGSTYYFQIEDIADTSSSKNMMGITKMESFTTISAQVALSSINETQMADGPIDMAFSVTPVSTSKVEDNTDWDMLLWSDTSVSFKLYERVKGDTAWKQVNADGGDRTITSVQTGLVGLSVGADFRGLTTFDQLNTLDEAKVYEYAIQFTKVDGMGDRATWSKQVNFKVSIAAGSSVDLGNLAADVSTNNFDYALANGVTNIGTPDSFGLRKQFTDSTAPVFTDGYPKFDAGDSSVDMTVLLDRPGTVYYVVAPVGTVTTNGMTNTAVDYESVPKDGDATPPELSAPGYLNIVNPKYSNSKIKTGSASVGTGAVPLRVTGLDPETKYYVYYVLKGTGQVFSDVLLYRFETTKVSRPIIKLDVSNPDVKVSTDRDATVDYILVVYNITSMDNILKRKFSEVVDSSQQADIAGYGANFTVLNALYRAYTVNGEDRGSVFDRYATQTAKDEIAQLVRSQRTTENVVGTGSKTIKGGVSVTVPCAEWMSDTTEYFFLAVGKSELGSGDAFRAIYPVKKPDKEAPKVTNVHSVGELDATGKKWSGNVAIEFDEELYSYELRGQGEEPLLRAIDLAPITGVSRKIEDFISVGSLASLSTTTVNVALDAGKVNQKTHTVSLVFTNALNGTYVTFDGSLADGFANVRKSTKFSIRLNIDKDGNVTFTIPGAWDAREGV